MASAGALAASRASPRRTAKDRRSSFEPIMARSCWRWRLGKAPITVGNFLRYVDTGRFDGATLYRASRAPGAPDRSASSRAACRTIRPSSSRRSPTRARLMTGLRTRTGLSPWPATRRARRRRTSSSACGDAPYLDADPDAPGDNAGYAAFGTVIQGMDVARAILALPTPGSRSIRPCRARSSTRRWRSKPCGGALRGRSWDRS